MIIGQQAGQIAPAGQIFSLLPGLLGFASTIKQYLSLFLSRLEGGL
jgi:hypothetical protein